MDENQETAAACGINCMPTFQFYKNGAKTFEMQGADPNQLTAKVAALNDDGLAAAYLDVLAEEPPRKDSPGAALVAHDRCFVTPHTAWATDQSRRRLVDTACASIAAFLRGDELTYQV